MTDPTREEYGQAFDALVDSPEPIGNEDLLIIDAYVASLEARIEELEGEQRAASW